MKSCYQVIKRHSLHAAILTGLPEGQREMRHRKENVFTRKLYFFTILQRLAGDDAASWPEERECQRDTRPQRGAYQGLAASTGRPAARAVSRRHTRSIGPWVKKRSQSRENSRLTSHTSGTIASSCRRPNWSYRPKV